MLTDIQKQNRKKGVGASESAIVMGLNSYISPYQLWMVKTGKLQEEDVSTLPQVYWGTIHEEQIAQEYARRNNCKVRKMSNTIYHSKYPYILCHIDRKIEGLRKLLECKFAMFSSENWGPSGSDIVPLSYIIQVQHQLAVTGYDEANLAVLISGYDYRQYHFKRDEQIIQKIIDEVTEFWRCVETDTPPQMRDRRDVSMAYPNSNGNYKEAEPKILDVIRKIKEMRAAEKAIEDEKEKYEKELTLFMQDAEGIKINDQTLVTWKSNARGSRVLRFKEDRV